MFNLKRLGSVVDVDMDVDVAADVSSSFAIVGWDWIGLAWTPAEWLAGLLNNFFISALARRVIGIWGSRCDAMRQIVVYSCRVLVFHGPVRRCTAIIALYALGAGSSTESGPATRPAEIGADLSWSPI